MKLISGQNALTEKRPASSISPKPAVFLRLDDHPDYCHSGIIFVKISLNITKLSALVCKKLTKIFICDIDPNAGQQNNANENEIVEKFHYELCWNKRTKLSTLPPQLNSRFKISALL